MIRGFADEGTRDLFHGVRSKAARRTLPSALWRAARRKLDRIDAAVELRDLSDPPGNRLEALQGNLAGLFSLRVNDRYRIVFRFGQGDASEVRVVDYH